LQQQQKQQQHAFTVLLSCQVNWNRVAKQQKWLERQPAAENFTYSTLLPVCLKRAQPEFDYVLSLCFVWCNNQSYSNVDNMLLCISLDLTPGFVVFYRFINSEN